MKNVTQESIEVEKIAAKRVAEAVSSQQPSKKRKADSLGRLSLESVTSGVGTTMPMPRKLTGRGSLDGCTRCPLCGKYSKKMYALGRGIASHLHAIHTPWNPTKLSVKIQRRKEEERMRLETKSKDFLARANIKAPISVPARIMLSWTPTQMEIHEWDETVLRILAQLEQEHQNIESNNPIADKTSSYRDSLPPFIQAAANGNLIILKKLLELNNSDKSIILDTKDRHLSYADHWAAGGGHLECLSYLMEMRKEHQQKKQEGERRRKVRRRDGKTPLHYAARNGHLNCVKYLVETHGVNIDEPSGEGTTPFHMACYGGHLPVLKYLVEKNANVHATNEWGCDAFHFVGLTLCQTDDIRGLCNYLLKDLHINLIRCQKQGHSILHKAAQKGNVLVIRWLADDSQTGAGLSNEEKEALGAPDTGGYKPSEIWRKFHKQDDTNINFAGWMEDMGW